MDCRKLGYWLAVGLMGGACGCQHGGKSAPMMADGTSTPVVSAAPVVVDQSLVKKEPKLPKRPPKAKTLVALADFRSAEARAPGLTEPVRRDHREVARRSYQQAIEVDPKYLPAYRGLGRLYAEMEDPAHALETYKRALAIAPDHGELWFDLGMLHNRRQEWDQAVDALDRAAGCDPENRLYVNTLGYTLARAGRSEEAFRVFAKITTEARAHYKVARMYEHLGKRDLARGHLRLAVAKDPRFDEARALLQWVESPPPKVRTVGHTQPAAGTPGR